MSILLTALRHRAWSLAALAALAAGAIAIAITVRPARTVVIIATPEVLQPPAPVPFTPAHRRPPSFHSYPNLPYGN